MQTNRLTPEEQNVLDELTELLSSDNWKHVRNLISRRRLYCEDQMKVCLKKQEDRKASEWLARSDELLHIIQMVQDQRTALIKQSKE